MYGEPWIACHICGFEIPQSQAVRHFKSKKLVDRKCADQPSYTDLLEFFRMPEERTDFSEQPIPNQGSVTSVGFGDYPFGEFPFGDPT